RADGRRARRRHRQGPLVRPHAHQQTGALRQRAPARRAAGRRGDHRHRAVVPRGRPRRRRHPRGNVERSTTVDVTVTTPAPAAAPSPPRPGWLASRPCFSFGHHYDPTNTHHGLLLVSNDDVVRPKTGFDTHPHRDMEIVTWVLSGELEHKDTLGNTGLIY